MKNHIQTLNDKASLELTRHENFIDGRIDMFDLLASKTCSADDGSVFIKIQDVGT